MRFTPINTATQNTISTMTGLTAAGTSGASTTFSGPIIASEGVTGNVSGNLDGTVSQAVQNSITTMAGLSSIGATGVSTVILGDLDVTGTQTATSVSTTVSQDPVTILSFK